MNKENTSTEQNLLQMAKAYGHYYGEHQLVSDSEDWLYMIDAETYDLKLVQFNKGVSPLDIRGDWHGRKCYDYLRGRATPCENCHKENVRSDNYYVNIINNPAIARDLFTKSINIDFNGRTCLLQTVIDITETDRRNEVMNEYILSRNVMINILSRLMEDQPIENIFTSISKDIGCLFGADRVIITEYQSGNLNSIWTADGKPYTQICTKLTAEGKANIADTTANLRYIWIPDVANAELLDDSIKKYWTENGISSILMIPMHYNNEFIGTLSLHNLKKHASQIDVLKLIGMAVAKTIYSNIIETTSELQLYTDPLTGALNFSGLKKKAYELVTSHPENNYCFCVCDIRYFSGINRRFSYELGDKILNKTAEALYEMLDDDEIYCRIAADQFCFIAKYRGEDEFRASFDRFIAKMQCFPVLNAANFKIEYQAGVYINDSSQNISISQAIDKANIARKTLKDFHGSGLAVFSSDMLEHSRREIDLIQDFKTALTNNEITVYYQPQCNYSAKAIAGAEALVRWNSPKHGFVSPGEFIPILESNGLIYELDRYVWELVCKHQRGWIDKGYKCPVSVNVSRYDVLKEGMCDELCALLDKYGIPKELLPLEITETAYIKNSDELINVVDTLKNAGFIVEMDDFGSGYSSLNALKDVAVDLLKLDMKFLDMNTVSSKGRGGSILNCIVRMTRWLNLPVLAEGVETKEQAEYLKSIGCDLMQGYYFAKPMPADLFEQMLSDKGSIDRVSEEESLISADSFMESIVSNPTFFNHIGAAAIVEYYNKECEALLINDSFLEMVDCTSEEYRPFLKQMNKYAVTVQNHADAAEIFDRIVKGVHSHDFVLKRKDGTSRNVRLYCRKLLSDNDRHILLLTLDDITDLTIGRKEKHQGFAD